MMLRIILSQPRLFSSIDPDFLVELIRMSKIPLIVILGPTSVGKTAVAIELAKRLRGEIVSADSRQVYLEMDIGTDKPSLEERQGIPHYMTDIVRPDEPFTLANYVDRAWKVILDIAGRGKIPFLVGSAGLYIRALTEGYVFPDAPPDEALRRELSERIRLEGTGPLFRELQNLDPEGARQLDPDNPRRLIRFYELHRQTGKLPSEVWNMRDPRVEQFSVFKFGLIRSSEKLRERITARVEEQEKRGLLDEVKRLLEKYPKDLKAFQTHSYQEVFPYLEGRYSWEEAKRLIVQHTVEYSRRQRIWFKKEKGVRWIEAEPYGDWQGLALQIEKELRDKDVRI